MDMETIAIFVIAGVLLWAGLEKVRGTSAITATIISLSAPKQFALPIALAISAWEIITALLVLFKPNYILTHIGILLLASLFAAAGFAAIAFGKSIKCNCFGLNGAGYLGKSQIITFPFWIFGVWILRYRMPDESPSLESGAISFAIVSLIIAAIRGIQVLRAQSEARMDRLSAQEMYVWLR